MTKTHGAKIMISDEEYAQLERAAKRRQVSLDYLCENIVNNYLCRYLEETVEVMWLPPEEKKEMLDKHSMEIDAKIYEGELRRKRAENSVTDGNLTRMGSVVETLEIGDMYPELKKSNKVRDNMLRYFYQHEKGLPDIGGTPQTRYFSKLSIAEREAIGLRVE